MKGVRLWWLAPIVLILVLFNHQAAHAEFKTWTPFFDSDDWHFGLNWDPGGVPDADDDVIVSVTNDLVVLNDDTALVDSILLINGADIRTNGHTLNLNFTGNMGVMTLGNGVNLSRLELDAESSGGKAADIDILGIGDGGQLDMDGGLIEIDNQLFLVAGGEIVGRGTIDLVRTGGVAATLDGSVDVAVGQTLTINATAGGEVDLGEAELFIPVSATLDINANINGAYTGNMTLGENALFEVAGPWRMDGSVNFSGATSGLYDESTIRSGHLTIDGTLTVSDLGRLILDAPVTFTSTANPDMVNTVGGVVRPVVEVLGPAVVNDMIEGGGAGTLVFRSGVEFTGVNLISEEIVVIGDGSDAQGLLLRQGTSLAVGVSPPEVNFSPMILEENATFTTLVGSGGPNWFVNAPVRMAAGSEIDADTFVVLSDGLEVTGGEAVFSGFNSQVRTEGAITIAPNATLRFEGETDYGSFLTPVSASGGAGSRIVQEGDANIRELDASGLELFEFGSSNTVPRRLDVDGPFQTNTVTLAPHPLARLTATVGNFSGGDARWDVTDSIFVGGSMVAAGGIATLIVEGDAAAGEGLFVQDTIKVYAASAIEAVNGVLETRNLVLDPGAALLMNEGAGTVLIKGGSANLDATFQIGSTGSSGQFPLFRTINGADTSLQSRWTIGELAGTQGRTEVTGLGPLNNPSTLRNTSNGSSADLFIGNAGNGELLVADGGLVDIGDDVIFGSQGTSVGTGEVDGVQNGVRSTLRTRTSGSAIAVGQNGVGSLDITDGALVESARNVFIAQFPGGSGQIHLFQTNSPNNGGFDSQLVVGDDLVVGGGTSSGGAGTLIIDEGGRVDVVETIIIRSTQAQMIVDGGEFTAARFSHTIGGVIELNSGRGEIEDPTINFPLTIGENGNPSAMELVITGQGTLDDLTIAGNGMLNVSGRVDVEVLNPGTGAIVLNGGTFAINAPQPGSVAYPVVVSASNGTFEIANAQHFLALDGNISGSGSLTKTGAGSLFLGGNNTFTGPLDVNAGRVVGNTASIPGDVQNTGLVVFNQTFAGTHAGVLSGIGEVEKVGTGTLTLNEENTYAGDTFINEGTLLAANPRGFATGTGTVHVNNGGTLAGNGRVGDVVVEFGGTVEPGDDGPGVDFDTLTVETIDFNSGGMLAIELGGLIAGTDHDLLEVNGIADLSTGVLDIDLAPGFTPSLGDIFTILEASGGITGQFFVVTYDAPPPGLEFDLLYGTNEVMVEISSANSLAADTEPDGDVDGADFLTLQRSNPSLIPTWQTEYGSGAVSSSTTAVPEPGCLLLLLTTLAIAASPRRKLWG